MNDEHRIIGIDIASGEDQTVTSFRCTGGISHTVGDMCPYCQLADTTQHAAELEASLSDHQRQLATCRSTIRTFEDQLTSVKAERDELESQVVDVLEKTRNAIGNDTKYIEAWGRISLLLGRIKHLASVQVGKDE